ncbi:hypothetical protein [Lacipirellula parvula]|uniref:PEP-CTERM protein-sorting domain-containing protein n=1 Tax=Lacipirellula parvula TaxID=2650471 RepID=A0A5K7X4I2_9BACT|nr:hypothetical protein [Lacipirellula parvula]BBO31468.1 hypothetical protein PLANPX_1080 [Lacipirellula parvula]
MSTRFVNAQKGAIVACALTLFGALRPFEAVEAAGLVAYQSQGGQAMSLFLRGDALNNSFNGMSLEVTGNSFLNLRNGLDAGVPRPAGQPFTYRNRALDLDPLDPDAPGIGKGWTVLSPIQTSTHFSFGGGIIGKQISTATEPRGELFLANLFVSDSFSSIHCELTLVNGVDTVLKQSLFFFPELNFPLPKLPEPSSAALLVTAGLAAIAARPRLVQVGGSCTA